MCLVKKIYNTLQKRENEKERKLENKRPKNVHIIICVLLCTSTVQFFFEVFWKSKQSNFLFLFFLSSSTFCKINTKEMKKNAGK